MKPSQVSRTMIARVPGADPVLAFVGACVTCDGVLIIKGRKSGRLRATNARPIVFDGHPNVVAICGDCRRRLGVGGCSFSLGPAL